MCEDKHVRAPSTRTEKTKRAGQPKKLGKRLQRVHGIPLHSDAEAEYGHACFSSQTMTTVFDSALQVNLA